MLIFSVSFQIDQMPEGKKQGAILKYKLLFLGKKKGQRRARAKLC